MITRKQVRLSTTLGSRRGRRALFFIAVYYGAVILAWEFGVDIEIPIGVAAVLGTALSILLGFRTNAAYGRWWEARKVWGGVVNDSRSFARKMMTLLSAPDGASAEDLRARQEELISRQIGWCYALSHSLRKEDILPGLAGFVPQAEVDALRDQVNVPNAILQTQAERLDALVAAGYIDNLSRLYLDDSLTRLCDHMGKCERIKSTVFPTSYAWLINCLVWLFTVLLPLGVVPHLGWIGIVLSFMVAGVFALIEAAAFYLQDPFENRLTDTAMTAISRTIEINLRQQLGQADVPPKLEPVDGVLM